MTRASRSTADAYPQLEAFFCGYLHQDFPEEHGDLAGAVTAFRRDAKAAERRAVRKEWRAFRAATSGRSLLTIGDQLTRGLGSAWRPRRKTDLEELDALIDRL